VRAVKLATEEMPERVTILGDGAMATVCSILLTTGDHAVTMWGAFEESIERLVQGPRAAPAAAGRARAAGRPPHRQRRRLLRRRDAWVLSAIPTQFMRSVWCRLKHHLPAGVPIFSVAKGIETSSLLGRRR
jgi:glycerol-3-phosphate dehydrogenase